MSQRIDLSVQSGTLGGPVLEFLPGLEDLRFLAMLDTEQKYLDHSNGPYPVARIIDPESLTEPLARPMISRASALNDRHKKLLEAIAGLDRGLGFNGRVHGFVWDQSHPKPGQPQRIKYWHRDDLGFAAMFASNKRMNRTYIVSSNTPTLYLREKPTRAPELWPRIETANGPQPLFPALRRPTSSDPAYKDYSIREAVFTEVFEDDEARQGRAEAFAREKGWLVEAEPFTVYLMPPLVYHRGQVMGHGVKRSFLRVTCG